MTALITGASGGIGLELAVLFAKDGHDLVLTARSEDKLLRIKDKLEEKYGVKCSVIPLDLARHGAAEELCEKLGDTRIDFLVNNAGFGTNGGFFDTDFDRSKEMLELNVTSLMELSYRIGRGMRERKFGRILNVASVAAFVPGPNMAMYYATKAFVLSFSEALSAELDGTGVTVTALCPGPTKTNFESAARLTGSRMFTMFKPAEADDVAEYGYRAMMRGKCVQLCGIQTHLINIGSRIAPRSLIRAAAKSVNGFKGEKK